MRSQIEPIVTDHRWPLKMKLLVVSLFVVMSSSFLQIAQADDATDSLFIEGLRQRQLYELAETFCREHLADENTTDDQRVRLVIELSRTLSQRAANAAPPARQTFWNQASGVLVSFVAEQPEIDRILLVKLQIPLTTLARAELSRQEAEILPHNRKLLDDARQHLYRTTRDLTKVQRQVAVALRERHRNNIKSKSALSARELLSMQRTISYQLARAERNVARCFANDSVDRVDALTKAIGHLTPLADAKATDRLSWKARLDRATCHRLLGHFEKAQAQLDAIITLSSSQRKQAQIIAEQIRLALAQKAIDRAESLLEGQASRNPIGSLYQRADLNYARLETYLAAWQRANASRDGSSSNDETNDNAKIWRTKATETTDAIGRKFGPYWARRAKILLATRIQSTLGGKDLTLLVSAAENYFHTGKLSEALATYDDAQKMAQDQGDAAAATRLAMAAAAIEQKRGRLDSALGRYRRLALAQPREPNASRAHLQAVWNAAKVYGVSSSKYTDLIDEHLTTWPQSSTAGDALCWLGRLQQSRREWQQACESYRAISATHRHHAEAVRSATDCFWQQLASLKAKGQPTASIARDAAAWLEELVTPQGAAWPKRLDNLQREAVLDAALLQMRYDDDRHADAERMLRRTLALPADTTASWRAGMRAALVLSLAGQGKLKSAQAEVSKLVDCKPEEILALLESLSELPRSDDQQVLKASAELQLDVGELIAPHIDRVLKPKQREAFHRIESSALADAGRRDEALESLRELAEKNPSSGKAQQRYAELLLAGDDQESLKKALRQWRIVERGSRSGTARWYEAKFSIARAHEKLGDRQQAARVVTLLGTLHPELGGATMKARFEALLARCKKTPSR